MYSSTHCSNLFIEKFTSFNKVSVFRLKDKNLRYFPIKLD